MVILVFLHMARTFFYGAYKYPRELNWVIGVALLILTMAMAFTGYLLPFDQRSYWATVVGNNINGSGPLVGPYLAVAACSSSARSISVSSSACLNGSVCSGVRGGAPSIACSSRESSTSNSAFAPPRR